jgi:cysteine desulfurase
MNEPVYLDHNATTPIRPEAQQAAIRVLALLGNPSSVHRFGRDVRRHIEDARESVAALLNAEPADVVFTSGGTEANTLAIRGSGRQRVLVSAVEHVSVLDAGPGLERIPVDGNGVVECRALAAMLGRSAAPALVSVMYANNETGVIQPVAEVAAIARHYGALVHCDAVQGTGKAPVDSAALDVDLLTVSAHKLGGPQGVGALIVRNDVPIEAIIRGGGQERGRRGGTENASGIAGFGAAARRAADYAAEAARLEALRVDLERRARAAVPETQIFGDKAARLANTTCLSLPGVSSETQVMALDLAGVAISAGAACSSGKVAASHVLVAMGAENAAREAIRVSLGWTSTPGDIERFIAAWSALRERVTASA